MGQSNENPSTKPSAYIKLTPVAVGDSTIQCNLNGRPIIVKAADFDKWLQANNKLESVNGKPTQQIIEYYNKVMAPDGAIILQNDLREYFNF